MASRPMRFRCIAPNGIAFRREKVLDRASKVSWKSDDPFIMKGPEYNDTVEGILEDRVWIRVTKFKHDDGYDLWGQTFWLPLEIDGQLKFECEDASAPAEETHAVYVSNLAWAVHWRELRAHMATVGTVVNAIVLTETGWSWHRSRGVGIVVYRTLGEARQAISSLNNSNLKGRSIVVDEWNGPGYCTIGFRQVRVDDSRQLVHVGNLPYKARQHELKECMASAGTVKFAHILKDESGWSRGIGCVQFASKEEAAAAVQNLRDVELRGRRIVVDFWHNTQPVLSAAGSVSS